MNLYLHLVRFNPEAVAGSDNIHHIGGTITCGISPVAALHHHRHTQTLKKRGVCRVKLKNEGFTKFGLLRICELNEFQSFTLQKLQRPFPVIMILRPARGIFSKSVTCAEEPASTRVRAAL